MFPPEIMEELAQMSEEDGEKLVVQEFIKDPNVLDAVKELFEQEGRDFDEELLTFLEEGY